MPYCRVLSDWEVEQAFVDWKRGKPVPELAEEYRVAPATLRRALKRYEDAHPDGAPSEPQADEPRPVKKLDGRLALIREMPDGTVYRLELGMRGDAVAVFAKIAAKALGVVE